MSLTDGTLQLGNGHESRADRRRDLVSCVVAVLVALAAAVLPALPRPALAAEGAAVTGVRCGSSLAQWRLVMTLSVVAEDAPPDFKPGAKDVLRIVYDPCAVDPATDSVRLLGLQHLSGAAWSPPSAQPASDQSVFSLRDRAVDFQRTAVHGTPILIVFTPQHWGAVYSQADGHEIIGGHYAMDEAGPTACDAASWRRDGTC